MLKDYEFVYDNKSDKFQNDRIVCLVGIKLAFIILNFFVMKFNKLYFVRQSKEEEVTNFIDCSQFRKDSVNWVRDICS
jgi:hypothetical protein